MVSLTFALSILNFIIIIIVGLILRSYLPSYFTEKGKNLATKEDIGLITEKIEKVRSQYISDIEKLKSSLEDEARRVEKRRDVYEKITKSLRIFITGHPSHQDQKDGFLNAYAAAWLWAPDEVLKTLNHFLSLQLIYAQNKSQVTQEELKTAYVQCVMAMRKDVGFSDTIVRTEDYQFIYFG